MILAIRTDNPQAELGLYDVSGNQLEYRAWQAHRELSDNIHIVCKELLDSVNGNWSSITGIIFYQGPGSFTGLRIGASVANALATASNSHLVNEMGDDWVARGLQRLQNGESEPALPEYGSEPHITAQKK